MKQVLLGLCIADVLVIGGAMALGWMAADGRFWPMHFALGLFAALYTTLLHSIVYIYFIVAGKLVGEAVDRAGLDAAMRERAKKLKMRTFRFALLGIMAVIVTALLGGSITAAGSMPGGSFDLARAAGVKTWHMIAAIVALLAQPAVFVLEFRNIGAQQELTAAAMAAYDAWRAGLRQATPSR